VKDESRAALISGTLCYTLWGLFPIYMHALARQGVDPFEITAERAAWAVVWAGFWCWSPASARSWPGCCASRGRWACCSDRLC